MSPRHSTDVHLSIDPSAARVVELERDPTSVSVLLLGDFSGRGAAGAVVPGDLAPRRVDRDTVDDVMAALAPSVSLDEGGRLSFASLDDLHPDALVGRLPRVGAILDGRIPPGAAGAEGDEADPPRASGGGGGSLLGRILDEVAGPGEPLPPPEAGPLDSIRSFAAEAARGHTVREPRPEEQARERTAQEGAADALRAFLRRPDVRGLERRWRGVDALVRRLDTGPGLHVFLADLSLEALAAEVFGDGGLEASGLRALLERGVGPERNPWSLVVLMDGSFGAGPDDQTVLAWVTGLCAAYGATVVADGEPELAGIATLEDLTDPTAWTAPPASWAAFRAQAEARVLGLALPGFLARDPYGRDTDPVDAFPFEEIPGVPRRADYAWIGGAVACAIVLARAAADRDRSGLPDDHVGGLPLHAWRRGIDTGSTCGASPMTDGAARRLMEAGLIPVAWSRGDDGVRVLLPRSVAGTSLWLGSARGR